MAVFALTWYGVCTLPLGPFAIALALVNCWSRACLTGIGHEAIHGRAKNALTFDFFDMIMLFPSDKWHDEHVIQHHPHTKRFDHDPDEVLDPFRLCQVRACLLPTALRNPPLLRKSGFQRTRGLHRRLAAPYRLRLSFHKPTPSLPTSHFPPLTSHPSSPSRLSPHLASSPPSP